MKKKLTIDKQALMDKVKFFSKRRYDFVLFLLVITIVYMSINLNNSMNIITKQDHVISKASMYATYITDSGVIKQYERSTFKVYREKYNVANILSKYLIQSSFLLTNAYKISTFNNGQALYMSYKPFQTFYNNFIAINKSVSTPKNIAALKNVKADWKQIMRWFTIHLNNNTLPQIIEKKNDSINFIVWNTHNNYFSIVIKVPVYVKSRTLYGKIKEGLSSALIQASGYFNLMDKSVLNPYGMKFTHLKVTHPVITQSTNFKGN